MKRFLIVVLLSCLVLTQPLVYGQSQSKEEEAIKIDATLINVPIVATDGQGKYVPDLQREDFEIYENGVRQEIDLFSAETVPFHVVLLLDTSSSATGYLIAIQRAANNFINALREGDKLMVIAFATELDVLTDFTANKRELKNAVLTMQAGGSTRLFDAVIIAARNKLKKVKGRKALIVLTDGEDRGSYMSARLAIDETLESGALTYAVRYSRNPNKPRNTSNQEQGRSNPYAYDYDFLGDFTRTTGGMLFNATTSSDVSSYLRNIADELRHIYSIGYSPANPVSNGGYRKIEVKLRERAGVTLRYKRGYDTAAPAK